MCSAGPTSRWSGARLPSGKVGLHAELAEYANDFSRVPILDAALRELLADRARLEDAWLQAADSAPMLHEPSRHANARESRNWPRFERRRWAWNTPGWGAHRDVFVGQSSKRRPSRDQGSGLLRLSDAARLAQAHLIQYWRKTEDVNRYASATKSAALVCERA